MKIDQLSDEARARAIEDHRYWNIEGLEWWEGVFEDVRLICRRIGIAIKHILFTGFCSQGDGACFEGSLSIHPDALPSVMSYAPQDTQLLDIVARWVMAGLARPHERDETFGYFGRVTHSGRYCHENCTSFEFFGPDMSAEQETEIIEAAREFMRWIYRQLEREHDYLTSDEAVVDALEANDVEFDSDGTKI